MVMMFAFQQNISKTPLHSICEICRKYGFNKLQLYNPKNVLNLANITGTEIKFHKVDPETGSLYNANRLLALSGAMMSYIFC